MISFACKKCGEIMEAPDSLAGRCLDCPKCKKSQVVPGTAIKIKQPAIDHWIYGGLSLLWLIWTLWKMLRYSSLEETNTLYEFYLMISAGFAWLGLIGSAMLGRLIKMG